MQTKWMLFLAMAIIFFSCNYKAEEKKLDNLWTSLINAKNATEEQEKLIELHDLLRNEKISYSLSSNGKDLHEISDSSLIESVTITFQLPERTVVKEGWKPKSRENAYYLYNE